MLSLHIVFYILATNALILSLLCIIIALAVFLSHFIRFIISLASSKNALYSDSFASSQASSLVSMSMLSVSASAFSNFSYNYFNFISITSFYVFCSLFYYVYIVIHKKVFVNSFLKNNFAIQKFFLQVIYITIIWIYKFFYNFSVYILSKSFCCFSSCRVRVKCKNIFSNW